MGLRGFPSDKLYRMPNAPDSKPARASQSGSGESGYVSHGDWQSFFALHVEGSAKPLGKSGEIAQMRPRGGAGVRWLLTLAVGFSHKGTKAGSASHIS